jgi:HlyD family secretion protein
LVEYGNLTVGITEESEINIGTVTQTFDLDITSYTGDSSETQSSDTGNSMDQGGMSSPGDMFSQIFSLASSSQSNETTQVDNGMEIETVMIAIGERVEVGDNLFSLTEESIEEIRDILVADVETAEATVNQKKVSLSSTTLSAEHNYEDSIAYGNYAQTEYEETLSNLQETVDQSNAELEVLLLEQESFATELTNLEQELIVAKDTLQGALSNVNSTDQSLQTYLYIQYENIREDALGYVEELETTIDELNEKIIENRNEIQKAKITVQIAQQNYEQGVLDAKEVLALRKLAYDYASETKEVATKYLQSAVEDAELELETAKEKLEEFDAYITDGVVKSDYSGLVTDISLVVGELVNTDSNLFTLYDDDSVTMETTLSEDEVASIALDDIVNISLTAFEDVTYQGIISEISDATYNSDTGLNEYTVVVTVTGDVSDLYESMSGQVTFITKETKEVLYVNNRAITRKGLKSYVSYYDENGNVLSKEVTTGFSDGIQVEIIEGLSEGDVVLIESKVNDK